MHWTPSQLEHFHCPLHVLLPTCERGRDPFYLAELLCTLLTSRRKKKCIPMCRPHPSINRRAAEMWENQRITTVNSLAITVTHCSLPYEMRAHVLTHYNTLWLSNCSFCSLVSQRRDQCHLHRAVCPWRVMHQKTSTHPASERESCPLSKGILSYSYYLIPTLMYVLHRAGHILTACSIQQRHKHLKLTIQLIFFITLYSVSFKARSYLLPICNIKKRLKIAQNL